MLDIIGGISRLIVGVYATNKGTKLADDWLRFGASFFGSAFITFWGVFGATGLASLANGSSWGVALAYAFFTAALTMATGCTLLWKRSPLTKGIPLWVPQVVEEKALETSGTYTEPK